MTPITGVGQVQIEHILREGVGTNLNLYKILEILEEINLNKNASLRASIEKLLMFLSKKCAKSVGNGLNK